MARSLERLRNQYAAKPEDLMKQERGPGRNGPPGRGVLRCIQLGSGMAANVQKYKMRAVGQ